MVRERGADIVPSAGVGAETESCGAGGAVDNASLGATLGPHVGRAMENVSFNATLGPPVVGVEPAIMTTGGPNSVERVVDVPAGTNLAAEVVPSGNAVSRAVELGTVIGTNPDVVEIGTAAAISSSSDESSNCIESFLNERGGFIKIFQ